MASSIFAVFSPFDYLAFLIFFCCWLGYEAFSAGQTRRGKHISAMMRVWREAWMRSMITRDNRMVDIQILRSLVGNSAFLATTSIFVIGGLAAMLGASEQAVRVLNQLSFLDATSQDRFSLGVAVLMFIFTYAFFRLAWSIRLQNNAAIVIGTVLSPSEAPEEIELAQRRASVAASMLSMAARQYNGGMHSYYFGLAACAWFVTPLALIIAALWVVLILYRRECRSAAYAQLRAELPAIDVPKLPEKVE